MTEQTQPPHHPREQRRATIAIVIAFLAVVFAAWQAWETRHANAKALDVARQALDLATKQFGVQHRPKLQFYNYTADTNSARREISLVVTFTNNGTTEAREVKANVVATLAHENDYSTQPVLSLSKQIGRILPTMDFHVGISVINFASATDFRETQEGHTLLYVTVELEYADAYGQHYTDPKWCGQYLPAPGTEHVFHDCQNGMLFDSSH